MKQRTLAVIGVGNMARAVIMGLLQTDLPVSKIVLYDKNTTQYESLPNSPLFCFADSASEAISNAECVLLAVKPQNYDEVLAELSENNGSRDKLYISIAAGITAQSVSSKLNGARVIRVLPNVPMLIGMGVSLICRNDCVPASDLEFVCEIFRSAGTVQLIDESDMNRMIGVTSSSPAYVFRFIHAIYQGALKQGLSDEDLLTVICDMVIGSAQMLKESAESPEVLISRVASKGGTTERALATLSEFHFDEAIIDAMAACTARADELGKNK